MQADPKLLVRRFYDALNRRNLDELDEMVASDLLHHNLPGMSGRDGLKRMLAVYRAGFPDLSHAIEDVIAEGDRTVVRTRTTGTHQGTFLGHAPTGRSFDASAIAIFRVFEGVIREIWEVFDTIAMLQQLGLYRATPDSPRAPAVRGAGRLAPGPATQVSLAQIRSDPLTFLTRLVREHGDCVRYVCDGRETILLNHPRAIRHVLHDRAGNYTKLNTPDLLLLKPMLGDGLLTTVGTTWKRDRQMIQPVVAHLTQGAACVMADVIQEMLARWRTRSPREAPFDIAPEMSRLTLEIAARVLLSTDLAGQAEAFGRAMSVLNEAISDPEPARPAIQRDFGTALTFIRRTVSQAILARRFHDTGEQDLLAVLLQSRRDSGDSDQHVIDQAVTMLLAGHETTAKALSWAIALLERHPEALATLHAELAHCVSGCCPSADELPNLHYTRAAVDEALRLYPPIWLLTRTATEDDEIEGYAIPSGTLVAISPYLIHRHEALWEDPDSFRPERFLSGDHATQEYRYLPFGHGARLCVGKLFAMLEMPLALASIFSQFALTSPTSAMPQPEALVTLRPRAGLPMIVTMRERHACI